FPDHIECLLLRSFKQWLKVHTRKAPPTIVGSIDLLLTDGVRKLLLSFLT
ncbi:hypothetical protein FOIG_16957, partial [Fusarium odoratissimum NRRL 54006]